MYFFFPFSRFIFSTKDLGFRDRSESSDNEDEDKDDEDDKEEDKCDEDKEEDEEGENKGEYPLSKNKESERFFCCIRIVLHIPSIFFREFFNSK